MQTERQMTANPRTKPNNLGSDSIARLVSFTPAIAAAVPPRPQDDTVSVIVLFTIVSSRVTDCNFLYCKMPL